METTVLELGAEVLPRYLVRVKINHTLKIGMWRMKIALSLFWAIIHIAGKYFEFELTENQNMIDEASLQKFAGQIKKVMEMKAEQVHEPEQESGA